MQELVDCAHAAGKGLGFFAALGDLWPWDGRPLRWALFVLVRLTLSFPTGNFSVPWSKFGERHWSFEEG